MPGHDDLPDSSIDDVDHELFVAVARQLPDMSTDALLKLKRPAQVFYITKVIEMDVLNGGFHQLIWNAADIAILGPAAFRELGALEVAAATEAAIEQAEKEKSTIAKHLTKGTLADFAASASESSLDEFDDAFCDSCAELPELRVRYAQEHPDAFAAPGADGRSEPSVVPAKRSRFWRFRRR